MAAAPSIVSWEVVAKRLGIPVESVTATQAEDITEAILDAQADVENALNRPLIAEQVIRTGLHPAPGYAQTLTSEKAWTVDFDDEFTVETVEAEEGGTYKVTFKVGLHAPNERPIVRYVTAAAVAELRARPTGGYGKRGVSSMSAEGQSITYDPAPKGEEAGALPTLASLRRYKRFGAYKANRGPRAPWPMDTAPIGWDPAR